MIKNAIINKVTLGTEDRDILTCWVHLDYDGAGQGFGGWALSLGESYLKRDPASEGVFTGEYLRQLLEVGGVDEFAKLAGKAVRAETDSDHELGGQGCGAGPYYKRLMAAPQ